MIFLYIYYSISNVSFFRIWPNLPDESKKVRQQGLQVLRTRVSVDRSPIRGCAYHKASCFCLHRISRPTSTLYNPKYGVHTKTNLPLKTKAKLIKFITKSNSYANTDCMHSFEKWWPLPLTCWYPSDPLCQHHWSPDQHQHMPRS